MNPKQDKIKQDESYKTPIYQQYVLIARNEINKILEHKNKSKKTDKTDTSDERRLGLNLANLLIGYIKKGHLKSAPKHSSWIYEVARIALKDINESDDLEKKVVEPFYSAMEYFSEINKSKEKKELSEEHKESLEIVGQLFERMHTIFGSEKLLKSVYKKWENWFKRGKQQGRSLYPINKEYKTLEKEVLEEINIKTKI